MSNGDLILKNRYRVLRDLGEGAFGKTFIVEDLDLPSRRRCVLKQLKSFNNTDQFQLVLERFNREAALLERLSEGAAGQIPRLYAYFADGDSCCLIQEWIDGKTLDQLQRECGRFPEETARQILIGLLPIIGYVHSQGVIHRDIKPENVIVRRHNGQLVLIDFGIVKEVMTDGSRILGGTSIVAGTPAFMPLEQTAGRPVFASDLYGLGLTVACLLTGVAPTVFRNRKSGEIKWDVHAPNIGPRLREILDRATAERVRDRYQSATEMLEAVTGTPEAELRERYPHMHNGAQYVTPLPPPNLATVAPAPSSFVRASTVGPLKWPASLPKSSPPDTSPTPPKPTARPVPAAPAPRTDSTATELAFWDSIRRSTNPKNFEAYLNKFPDGPFSELARIRLDELRADPRARGRVFEFNTVTVDERGTITEHRTKRVSGFVERVDGVMIELVSVPAGAFIMGSLEHNTERPPHQVRVSGFCMGRHPVTQEQWRAAASQPAVKLALKPEPSFHRGDKLPVEQVSWDEAVEFCARLSRMTGKAYRLPTEAEWEYACRAETLTPFAFGETLIPELVNYDGNFPHAKAPKGKYLGATCVVGLSGAANLFGLYDMHGNVFEWVQDAWHPDYHHAPSRGVAWDNPVESKRVARGGSWISGAAQCRSAGREFKPRDTRANYLGFRVAVTEILPSDARRRPGSGELSIGVRGSGFRVEK